MNNQSLTVPSASLGAVDSRRFVLVEGVGSQFVLTGKLRINKANGAQEIPSMIVFAGTTDYRLQVSQKSTDLASIPEPGIGWMVGLGLLLAAAGRGWNRNMARCRA